MIQLMVSLFVLPKVITLSGFCGKKFTWNLKMSSEIYWVFENLSWILSVK